MFYFDKKIYYIDYYENGNRISNAGFISLTFKDDECLVHVGIRNMDKLENRTCRWFGLINSEQVFLEEFKLEKGRADFVNCYRSSRMGKNEVDFASLEGFYFALGKRRWGSCFFRNTYHAMEPVYENISVDRPLLSAADQTEEREEEVEEEPFVFEEIEQDAADEESAAPVHHTTWDELIETHQIVHPFDNQGDYISINPFTLKMLAPEYRKLANNSFLLHGFYNYRHLILGYYVDGKREGYYIGVPGTFDEREQMVAEMFGFEGYEPAGGVGYYMRKVEF